MWKSSWLIRMPAFRAWWYCHELVKVMHVHRAAFPLQQGDSRLVWEILRCFFAVSWSLACWIPCSIAGQRRPQSNPCHKTFYARTNSSTHPSLAIMEDSGAGMVRACFIVVVQLPVFPTTASVSTSPLRHDVPLGRPTRLTAAFVAFRATLLFFQDIPLGGDWCCSWHSAQGGEWWIGWKMAIKRCACHRFRSDHAITVNNRSPKATHIMCSIMHQTEKTSYLHAMQSPV